jgi:hypothetical protein
MLLCRLLYISIRISVKKTTHYKDPIGHGGLDRTKRLINAAIRLWELRQESPQYSSSANLTCDGSENQSNRLSSATPGSSRSPSIDRLASDSRFGTRTQGERASEHSEAGASRAERLVRKALAQLGWREKDLALHPKGHQSKVKLARQLREQTPMTYGWIGDRLHMGSASNVCNLLTRLNSKR